MKDATGKSNSEWSVPYFGLELRLLCPASAPFSLASNIKALFDGVITSLHSYPDPPMDVAERVATIINAPTSAARDALANPWSSVLGPRRLVWPRGRGVQWNPADDKCVAGELLRVNSTDWLLAGTLSEVSPTASP
jgi:hypothetical protein